MSGVVGLNYTAAPLGDEPRARLPEPRTPVIEAHAGDALRIHVLAPWSEQAHVFAVEGHRWPVEPGRRGSDLVDAVQLGGLNALTLHIDQAGGDEQLPGDYVYGDHREPYREAGVWGILRVRPACAGGIEALAGSCGQSSRWGLAAGAGAGVAGAAVAALAATRSRRQSRLSRMPR